jgi:hypothetical protein
MDGVTAVAGRQSFIELLGGNGHAASAAARGPAAQLTP